MEVPKITSVNAFEYDNKLFKSEEDVYTYIAEKIEEKIKKSIIILGKADKNIDPGAPYINLFDLISLADRHGEAMLWDKLRKLIKEF